MQNESSDLLVSFAAPEEFAERYSGNDNSPQAYRNMFMRDRDRVLYSKSFRRLSGKTQIYLTGENDHQRNRLTHTLEVSQIATTISQALCLNRDLAEAIALGHDLGHAPFGHAGEQELHMLMVPNENGIKNSPFNMSNGDQLGFKHNLQSVRVAATLENIYGDSGLDLTNYTLWGLQRHSSSKYAKGRVNTTFLLPSFYSQYDKYYKIKGDHEATAWSFEAFVVAEADEIAQLHHDLEDAIRGNAMTRVEVIRTLRSNLWDIMSNTDRTLFDKMKNTLLVDETFIVYLSRIVVNTLVSRIIVASKENLETIQKEHGIVNDRSSINNFFLDSDPDSAEIKNAISYCTYGESDAIFNKLRKYSRTIATKVHNSLTVQRMNTKGQYVIRKLFQAYFANPQQLPNHTVIQFLIAVGEYKSKESAAKAIKQKGGGRCPNKIQRIQKIKEI